MMSQAACGTWARCAHAKSGKFLCLEPLFWQSEASLGLEIPWEPRAFSEGSAPA